MRELLWVVPLWFLGVFCSLGGRASVPTGFGSQGQFTGNLSTTRLGSREEEGTKN